jgi:hypothetical protein
MAHEPIQKCDTRKLETMAHWLPPSTQESDLDDSSQYDFEKRRFSTSEFSQGRDSSVELASPFPEAHGTSTGRSPTHKVDGTKQAKRRTARIREKTKLQHQGKAVTKGKRMKKNEREKASRDWIAIHLVIVEHCLLKYNPSAAENWTLLKANNSGTSQLVYTKADVVRGAWEQLQMNADFITHLVKNLRRLGHGKVVDEYVPRRPTGCVCGDAACDYNGAWQEDLPQREEKEFPLIKPKL